MYVFVFFKQKTAYEMRISDWSSDVCSSDLRGVAEVRKSAIHRGLQGTRRAQRAPPPRRRSEIARRDRRVGGQSCAGPRLSRQAARRSGDDRDAEDDAAGEGIADREPRGRDRAVRREIRSEEHTSELQSLMRISYAVFCLKKNTTKNQNNTNSR